MTNPRIMKTAQVYVWADSSRMLKKSASGEREPPDYPSCSQNAHDEREGMEPDDLLCSRNARPQKALVGRAQWKINQPPSLRNNEHAWRDHL